MVPGLKLPVGSKASRNTGDPMCLVWRWPRGQEVCCQHQVLWWILPSGQLKDVLELVQNEESDCSLHECKTSGNRRVNGQDNPCQSDPCCRNHNCQIASVRSICWWHQPSQRWRISADDLQPNRTGSLFGSNGDPQSWGTPKAQWLILGSEASSRDPCQASYWPCHPQTLPSPDWSPRQRPNDQWGTEQWFLGGAGQQTGCHYNIPVCHMPETQGQVMWTEDGRPACRKNPSCPTFLSQWRRLLWALSH